LSGFIRGLKDEIRPIVRMVRPTTLAHVFEAARLQEQWMLCNSKAFSLSRYGYNSACKPSFASSSSNKSYKTSQPLSYPPKPPNDNNKNQKPSATTTKSSSAISSNSLILILPSSIRNT